MADRIIVTPEELNSLKQLQQSWNILTKRWGEISYEQRILAKELESLLSMIDSLEQEREAHTKQLQEKYQFYGSIDLETGEFTPIS